MGCLAVRSFIPGRSPLTGFLHIPPTGTEQVLITYGCPELNQVPAGTPAALLDRGKEGAHQVEPGAVTPRPTPRSRRGGQGPPDGEDVHGLGPLQPLPRGYLPLQGPCSGGPAVGMLAVVQEGRRLRGRAQALQGRIHVVHQRLQVHVVLCASKGRERQTSAAARGHGQVPRLTPS